MANKKEVIVYNQSFSPVEKAIAGTSWWAWYDVRFSHNLDHPYYLEINGIRS